MGYERKSSNECIETQMMTIEEIAWFVADKWWRIHIYEQPLIVLYMHQMARAVLYMTGGLIKTIIFYRHYILR